MLAFHAARRLRAGAIVQALDALRPAHSSAAAATRATTVTWNTAAADALDAALLRPSSSTTTTAAAWSASADAAAVPPPPPPPEDAGPPSSSSSSTTTATSSTPAAAAAADDDDEDAAAAALTPRAVVEHLDRHIVGQAAAKRAVANALRARWRRHRVRPAAMREEIVPKNILMIGPTGTGKTEIARRLAKLSGAPFIKVEATKYTEVGFHGRDVEDIIRGLLDNAILLAKDKARARARAAVASAVEDRLLAALCGEAAGAATIESFRSLYRSGALDDRRVVLDPPPPPAPQPYASAVDAADAAEAADTARLAAAAWLTVPVPPPYTAPPDPALLAAGEAASLFSWRPSPAACAPPVQPPLLRGAAAADAAGGGGRLTVEVWPRWRGGAGPLNGLSATYCALWVTSGGAVPPLAPWVTGEETPAARAAAEAVYRDLPRPPPPPPSFYGGGDVCMAGATSPKAA